MRPSHIFAALLVLSASLSPSALGEKKNAPSKVAPTATPVTDAPKKATAAADRARLVAYYQKVIEWTETSEGRSIRAKKDLGSFLAKLVEIARGVGYEGDAKRINKQISSDQRAFRKAPEVEEWAGKFQKAIR